MPNRSREQLLADIKKKETEIRDLERKRSEQDAFYRHLVDKAQTELAELRRLTDADGSPKQLLQREIERLRFGGFTVESLEQDRAIVSKGGMLGLGKKQMLVEVSEAGVISVTPIH